jgi:glutamate-5-semialdehyde dehydrogenase
MINNSQEYIRKINQKSKKAFNTISISNTKKRNLAILNTSKFIESNKSAILDANKIDIENAKEKNVSDAFLDRLFLNDKRIQDIINGLKQIAEIDDPLGCRVVKMEKTKWIRYFSCFGSTWSDRYYLRI